MMCCWCADDVVVSRADGGSVMLCGGGCGGLVC